MPKTNDISCTIFEREIWLYISGELSPERKKQVEAHIENCSNCKALLKSNTEISRLYSPNMQEDILDSTFERIISETIASNTAYHKITRRFKKPAILHSFGKVILGTTIAAVSVIAILITITPKTPHLPDSIIPTETGEKSGPKAIKWDDTEQRAKIAEISNTISHINKDPNIADKEWNTTVNAIESGIDSLKFCINN